MISFKILDRLPHPCELSALCPGDTEYLSCVLSSFLELCSEDLEIAYTVARDCLLCRISSEGEYIFIYPVALIDEADVASALLDVAKYTRAESLPLAFSDVPREELETLSSLFLHIDAKIYDEDEDCFFVRVRSEASLAEGYPEISEGEISLGELSDSDKEAYGRICSDVELNKYWGYDVRVDNPSGDPDRYLAVARAEWRDGVAISLAIRIQGQTVGECVIYDFDYQGSASIALRVMKEAQGQGVGSRALRLLIRLCKELGLKSLRAEVMEQNLPSLKMTRKFMSELASSEGKVSFEKKL